MYLAARNILRIQDLERGYIIVNMSLFTEDNKLVEDTWYFVKEMDGVIGFAGTKDQPIPMRQREVESMLAQIKEREESVQEVRCGW